MIPSFYLGFVVFCGLVRNCVWSLVVLFCFVLGVLGLFCVVYLCWVYCLQRFVCWCVILGLWIWSGFVLEVCGFNIFKICVM